MDFQEKLKNRVMNSRVRDFEDGLELLTYMTRTFPRLDKAAWRNEIMQGHLAVNNVTSCCSDVLHTGNLVSFYPGDAPEPAASKNYRIVYQDEYLLVIDKPPELCVHPSGPFFRNTLWHILGTSLGREVHFINRLDKDTSGLLVVALDSQTAALMDNRQCRMHKEYLALVFGNFQGKLRARGRLATDDNSTLKKKRHFVRMTIMPDSPESAFTELTRVAAVGSDMTLVRAVPRTGRQHQIRATLCSLGFPLLGDKMYGPDENLFLKIPSQSFTEADWNLLRMRRQALHSAKLIFQHPRTWNVISCEAPLPQDFTEIINNQKI